MCVLKLKSISNLVTYQKYEVPIEITRLHLPPLRKAMAPDIGYFKTETILKKSTLHKVII